MSHTLVTFKNVCKNFDDISDLRVLETVGLDARIGTKFMLPGGPYSGPCLPRDNLSLKSFLGADLLSPLWPSIDFLAESDFLSFLISLAMSAPTFTAAAPPVTPAAIIPSFNSPGVRPLAFLGCPFKIFFGAADWIETALFCWVLVGLVNFLNPLLNYVQQ